MMFAYVLQVQAMHGAKINGFGVADLFQAYWLAFNLQLHAPTDHITADNWLHNVSYSFSMVHPY